MASKRISKSVYINASKEKVWNTLFNNATYLIWAAEFAKGSKAETDWKEGSEARFTDGSNSGLIGTIEKSQPFTFLSIKYKGALINGAEDTESDMAKEVAGGIETYTLQDQDGGTQLSIESDMDEKYFDMMSDAWDRALARIKELAEAQ